jgi:hypothetical protein
MGGRMRKMFYCLWMDEERLQCTGKIEFIVISGSSNFTVASVMV